MFCSKIFNFWSLSSSRGIMNLGQNVAPIFGILDRNHVLDGIRHTVYVLMRYIVYDLNWSNMNVYLSQYEEQ